VIRFSTLVTPGAAHCDAFGFLPFRPGSYGALEGDAATVRLDGDARRIELRTAPEGLLDLLLDLGGRDTLLDVDQVGDALDPA